MKCVGLISGTSADGVDAALIEIKKSLSPPKLLCFITFPIPGEIRTRIFDCFETGKSGEICGLNFILGELFAEAAISVIHKAGLRAEDVELIGSHGQTIYHLPPTSDAPGSTLQIAEPAVIAHRTGITTVADFRVADMAAGGQGAPLLPILHHRLFSMAGKNVAVVNIGGIANVTFLPGNMQKKEIAAFDTGPGNMVIDALTQKYFGRPYDENGCLAASGKTNKSILDNLILHPFCKKVPPKSTGREEFGYFFAEEIANMAKEKGVLDRDVLRTVTELTAYSITRNCRDFLPENPDRIWICGGGVKNSLMMELLEKKFSPVPVQNSTDCGIDPDALEAMGFAYMAYLTFNGLPGNLPSVTGAGESVVLGKIIPAGRGLNPNNSVIRNKPLS